MSGDCLDYKSGNLLIGCYDGDEPLTLWDFNKREKLCGIPWTEDEQMNDAFVYSCGFSRSGDDFIVAAAIGRNEMQLFEKDLVYKPTWTIKGLKHGLYSCDVSPKGDGIAFGGADQHIYILDIGKIV